MSLIHVECAACGSALHCKPEHAGQQGRCPKCGSPIAVPAVGAAGATSAASDAAGQASAKPASGASAPAPSSVLQQSNSKPANSPAAAQTSASLSSVKMTQLATPLWQASAPEMLAEVFRRKKSAVMVVFETPSGGAYNISQQPEANVRCYRTADMSDVQLMQVLEQLGHMSQGMQNQKGGIGLRAEGPEPFELKGDRLGITLEEFKQKYARKIGSITMPFCSDSCPGQPNESVWSEPWHVAAGLVNGRIDLPSEGNPPTIAGVRTERFLYHFVDGKLFKMTVLFDTEAFHLIHEALVKKQGTPSKENREKMEFGWENGVSTIKLTRGTMRPKKFSTLIFMHDQLQKSSEGRAPQRSTDL